MVMYAMENASNPAYKVLKFMVNDTREVAVLLLDEKSIYPLVYSHDIK